MRTYFFVGALTTLYNTSRAAELEAETSLPPEFGAFAGPLAEDSILNLAQIHSHSHGHNHLDAWADADSEGDSDADVDGDLDADLDKNQDVGDVALMAMARARKQKAAAAAAANKKAAAPKKKAPSSLGGVVDFGMSSEANKDKLRALKAAK